MKGVMFVIAFTFCCLLPASTVYAGTLNEYEKQVVAEAKRSYVYQGNEYHLTESSLSQLTAYLSQDDIDITAEQRDKILQSAYANIEQGVLEGYLVPVEEVIEKTTPTPIITIAPNDTPQETEEQNQVPIPKIADTEEPLKATEKPPVIAPESPGNGLITEKPLSEKEEIEKLFETILTEEKASQTSSNQVASVDASIITETGFDFNSTLIVIVGIIILMIIGFGTAIRSDYFAHNDE